MTMRRLSMMCSHDGCDLCQDPECDCPHHTTEGMLHMRQERATDAVEVAQAAWAPLDGTYEPDGSRPAMPHGELVFWIVVGVPAALVLAALYLATFR